MRSTACGNIEGDFEINRAQRIAVPCCFDTKSLNKRLTSHHCHAISGCQNDQKDEIRFVGELGNLGGWEIEK